MTLQEDDGIPVKNGLRRRRERKSMRNLKALSLKIKMI
jgi:hypothetical protein